VKETKNRAVLGAGAMEAAYAACFSMRLRCPWCWLLGSRGATFPNSFILT